ncbi:DedA family protein [Bacillus sp. JJ722]|uniref:DedA family protein n=1 Tax=Bacillus sp. JJ722 TaxID=3122973 RepID=UPI002FFFDCCA
MTYRTGLSISGVIFFSTVGSVIGAVILYFIGRLVDVKRLEKIIDRYGKILRLKKEDLYKADNWFDRYGTWTVLFCRLVPILRSLISIPAGMSNMNFAKFIFLTTIGTLVWNTVLVYLGSILGTNWNVITYYMDIYSNIILLTFIILIIILIIWYMKKRIK